MKFILIENSYLDPFTECTGVWMSVCDVGDCIKLIIISRPCLLAVTFEIYSKRQILQLRHLLGRCATCYSLQVTLDGTDRGSITCLEYGLCFRYYYITYIVI